MKLLLTGPGYHKCHLDRAHALGFQVEWQLQPTQEFLVALAPALTHYVLGGDERLGTSFFTQAPNLRRISFVGGDVGAFVDLAAAASRGIEIVATPGVTAGAVAEHSIGLLLGLTRNLFAHVEAVKDGRLLTEPTRQLSDLRVGVLGLGRIGIVVARILSTSFGARVAYSSRHRNLEAESELGLEWLSLSELFRTCDVISLHAPAQPRGQPIVTREILTQAKRGLLLVNTAPASIVDATAIKEAIADGLVAAAAFDGYWNEPLPAPVSDSFGLLSLAGATFVATPHVAAKTTSAWPRMIEAAMDNVCRGLE